MVLALDFSTTGWHVFQPGTLLMLGHWGRLISAVDMCRLHKLVSECFLQQCKYNVVVYLFGTGAVDDVARLGLGHVECLCVCSLSGDSVG